MKRFFCTTCKKVKRVRRLPSIIQHVDTSVPQDRIGQCDWHLTGRIRPIRRQSVRVRPNEIKVSVPKRKR